MRALAQALALVAALLLLGASGCGDDAEDAAEAVAGLLASEDCLTLMSVGASIERGLGGGAGDRELASASQFLAGFASRAPHELAGDVAVARQAVDRLAAGHDPATIDQAGTRRAAVNLASWARTSCPG